MLHTSNADNTNRGIQCPRIACRNNPQSHLNIRLLQFGFLHGRRLNPKTDICRLVRNPSLSSLLFFSSFGVPKVAIIITLGVYCSYSRGGLLCARATATFELPYNWLVCDECALFVSIHQKYTITLLVTITTTRDRARRRMQIASTPKSRAELRQCGDPQLREPQTINIFYNKSNNKNHCSLVSVVFLITCLHPRIA